MTHGGADRSFNFQTFTNTARRTKEGVDKRAFGRLASHSKVTSIPLYILFC
jgi:hypothetical protein